MTAPDTPLEADPHVPFRIEIPSGTGGGYRWTVTRLPGSMELRDASFEIDAGAAPGDPGTQVFHLVGHEPGEFAVELACGREWEAEPVERRSVPVTIRG